MSTLLQLISITHPTSGCNEEAAGGEDGELSLAESGSLDSWNTLHIPYPYVGYSFPYGGVVHCFTGTIPELQDYLALGFYVGLTGWVHKIPQAELVEMLTMITQDKLLLETDAPYMGFADCRSLLLDDIAVPPPVPDADGGASNKKDKKRSSNTKRRTQYPNVPSSLVLIVNYISHVMTSAGASDWTVHNIAHNTTHNAEVLFRMSNSGVEDV